MKMLRTVGVSVWFLAVGLAFFLPYAGVVLPLTPVYGLFLLVVSAVAALRLLERGKGAETAVPEPIPTQPAVPTRKEGRRGK